MSIQGTKHWQLGMFFVVSLMLMVGLFTNIAPAHDHGVAGEADENGEQADDDDTPSGEVEITPKVTADSMVDLVIRYESDGALAKEGKVTLVDPADKASNVETNTSTYGRIQITLPAGWGPDGSSGDEPENQINEKRVPGTSGLTYLISKYRKAAFEAAEDDDDDVDGLNATYSSSTFQWTITIDVDDMQNNGYVLLTIKDLMIPALTINRDSRVADIDADRLAGLMGEVIVLANQYDAVVDTDLGDVGGVDGQDYDGGQNTGRDSADMLTSSNSHPPEDIHEDNKVEGKDQPQVTVERKKLGKLTVSKDSVTAGSLNDLTLTYKFTEATMKTTCG